MEENFKEELMKTEMWRKLCRIEEHLTGYKNPYYALHPLREDLNYKDPETTKEVDKTTFRYAMEKGVVHHGEGLLPIAIFSGEEELSECVEYWKKILYLDDWVIKTNTRSFHLYPLQERYHSRVKRRYEDSTAEIILPCYDREYCDALKNVLGLNKTQEYGVLRELIHLKEAPGEYEIFYCSSRKQDYLMPHAMSSEWMVKSLLMAKYEVDQEYFLESYDLGTES